MIILLWIVLLLLALLMYNKQAHSRFKRYGVKNCRPLPLLGNLGRILMRKQHISEQLEELYHKFPEERFVGGFKLTQPILFVKDSELLKKITVKDFEHFVDHGIIVDESMDPLLGRNLLSLKGQEWKDMRSTLSPAFTSSKMRLLIPFMQEVSKKTVQSLKKKIGDSGVNHADVETFDVSSRFSNDVIASCSFGLKLDSHSDIDNDFFRIGKDFCTTGFRRVLVFLGYSISPWLMRMLGIKFFTENMCNFFAGIILQAIKEREEKNIFRPDMIHLLMEAKKGKLIYDEARKAVDGSAGFATVEESHVGKTKVNREWTDNDLVAQALLFYLAGFEPVSTAMSFLLYELACHPDIQDRLAQEIKEHDIKNEGQIDYKSIQSMTYLDMVVSEILRLWTPVLTADRLCVKDYNMGKPSAKAKQDYIIREGEALVIPTWSIHHDPEYYPDPYKFDPERFSEENRNKIKPHLYLPFGVGPRNCIGSRFVLCEIKVMIYQLMLELEVSTCDKTHIPAKLNTDSFSLKMKDGNWLRFRMRQ